MCAALIGGMDRLRQVYIDTAKNLGVTLKVFTGQERSIKKQLGSLDMIILSTGKVSHAARVEALQHAKTNNIPVRMVHAPGISSLRECLTCGCSCACGGDGQCSRGSCAGAGTCACKGGE